LRKTGSLDALTHSITTVCGSFAACSLAASCHVSAGPGSGGFCLRLLAHFGNVEVLPLLDNDIARFVGGRRSICGL
jgi:hypothetical protein